MSNRSKLKSIVRLPNSGGFSANTGSTCEAQCAELLFKGNREDIRLMGIYPLKKHKYLYAYAYDGQLKPNGKKNFVGLTTEETDLAKARAKGEKLVIDLLKQWDQKYGTKAVNSSAKGVQLSPPPDYCIEQLIVDKLDILRAELGEGNRTLQGYLAAGRFILEFLGPKRARGRFEILTEDVIVRLKEARLRKLNAESGSPKTCIYNLRHVLEGLPGFKDEWLKLLKAPKLRGALAQKFSEDFPFLIPELKLMHDNLPRALDTAKGLYLFGASGTMHSGDAVLTRWAQFDEAMEAIAEGRRMKNGNPFRYGIWPELETWLKTRKREPGDSYIFPELIFRQERLKSPLCNKTRLSPQEEKSDGIKARAWIVFHEFLVLCGITRKGVSFRSFRTYNSSELFAAGYPVPLLKAVTGHTTDENFFKYVHILPRHIRRLAEYHRRHYQAIVAGKELPVYLTHTEVVEELTSVAAENQAELKRFAARLLDSLGVQIKTQLEGLILAGMNGMAAQIVNAFCSALGGQRQPCADGNVVIQLPRLSLPENLVPAPGFEGESLLAELGAQPQLALIFPDRENRSLN